jgi:N-acetyl-anhydromuramyl-L-alanine amidase AmpD
MRKIEGIVLHCSATPAKMDIGAKEITAWHKERGMLTIGYHFVIRRNGTVEKGRDIGTVGAHVEGHNAKTIGICLVGGVNAKMKPEANFTGEQFITLKSLLNTLKASYPTATILGHRDYNPKKACPSFDVKPWVKTHLGS